MKDIEAAFDQDMRDSYHELANQGYRATYFLRMVEELGGVEAARHLLEKDEIAEGLGTVK